MKNVTVRMSDEKVEELDAEADEQGLSRAEYIRSLIESRHESSEVEDELERLRNERERLERKLQATNDRQDDVDELVEFVEDEKMRRSRSERREEKWHDGSIWQRAKWKLTGIPLDDEDE